MAVDLDARAAGARRLKDKVCVVTGAGQGIGRATARRLGQEGGKIVVADRVDAAAIQTEAELRDHGVEAMKVLVDLSTFGGAQDLMSQALDAYGRIDVLVNNVGGTIWIKPYGPLFRFAELLSGGCHQQRHGDSEGPLALDAPDQFHPGNNVSPLVAAAHLYRAPVMLEQVQEII